MQIGRKDLFWNYAATSMRILSGIIVLPVVLRMFPSEEVGIWGIFLSLMTITALLDFGFSNSFSRNVTYVYSGAKELKVKGYSVAETSEVDYGLLKSLLLAMKRYYGIIAIVFLIIFLSASPFYLSSVLAQYSGDKQPIWIAWYIFGGVLAYELYTFYYGSILQGRGLIKRNMQIVAFSQSIRIIATLTFLFAGLGFISLVLGLLTGSIINRILSYYVFYDKVTRTNLRNIVPTEITSKVIKIVLPNSVRLGLVALGSFGIHQAIVLISPFYLSLPEVASYTISRQLVMFIYSFGFTWLATFIPQLSHYRVRQDYNGVKRLYIKGTINMIFIFIVLGTALLLLGNYALDLINSKTSLVKPAYLFLMLLFAFLDANQYIAISTLLTKNEVPYFKSVMLTGCASVLLLIIMFNYTSLGVLCLILAPNIAMCAYQNWKWSIVVIKEINLQFKDYIFVMKSFYKGGNKQ